MYIKRPSEGRWLLIRIYDIFVLLEFDAAKRARNVRDRGIGFDRFADMDLRFAVQVDDLRRDYGEHRVRMFGPIDGRLHAAVITARGGHVRVISLRRANAREERWYEEVLRSAG